MLCSGTSMALKAGLTCPSAGCMPMCQIAQQGKPASQITVQIYSCGLWLLEVLDGLGHCRAQPPSAQSSSQNCSQLRELLPAHSPQGQRAAPAPRSGCGWGRALGCRWQTDQSTQLQSSSQQWGCTASSWLGTVTAEDDERGIKWENPHMQWTHLGRS